MAGPLDYLPLLVDVGNAAVNMCVQELFTLAINSIGHIASCMKPLLCCGGGVVIFLLLFCF